MTKEEIIQRVSNCKTEEDIDRFLDDRLAELENETEEKTVGQWHTDEFNDFISSKVHYKPVSLGKNECPDLVYDVGNHINH